MEGAFEFFGLGAVAFVAAFDEDGADFFLEEFGGGGVGRSSAREKSQGKNNGGQCPPYYGRAVGHHYEFNRLRGVMFSANATGSGQWQCRGRPPLRARKRGR